MIKDNDYATIKLQKDLQIKFEKTIKLQNIDFKYDKKKEYQLKNVNLEINKNDRIGIIGESGAGKSTLLGCNPGLINRTMAKY